MTSGFYKYLNLIKNDTAYARKMDRLRKRIFGEVTRPTNSKSMKVVRLLSPEPVYKQNWVTNWYPRHRETHYLMKNLRDYGLFRDEHQDFQEEMLRQKILRGRKKPFVPTRDQAKK